VSWQIKSFFNAGEISERERWNTAASIIVFYSNAKIQDSMLTKAQFLSCHVQRNNNNNNGQSISTTQKMDL